jgi:hypothetical protein
MLDMVTNLISEKKIPTLNPLQMEAFLHYLFTATPREYCIQVAEVAYLYDRGHPRATDVFLASAMTLAKGAAYRRATRIFVHPSDLQIELMYGGAVEAVVNISRSKQTLKAEHNAFRRYLLRAMALGAVCAYFKRGTASRFRSAFQSSPSHFSFSFTPSSTGRTSTQRFSLGGAQKAIWRAIRAALNQQPTAGET